MHALGLLDDRIHAVALLDLGILDREQGDYDAAQGRLVESVRLVSEQGDRYTMCLGRVEAGVTAGEFAAVAQPQGLAISTGDTSSVGFGDRVTGGGIGFMVRRYGLAIDNLVAAPVVTAPGKLVTASDQEHPDLF